MVDISRVRLGKKPPKYDLRTLQLSRYLLPELPAPPDSCDWSNLQPNWGMMLNDRLGCCTIAGCAHAIQTWTLVINQRLTVADEQILSIYEEWDGYKNGDSTTDNGGVELDVLTKWRQRGFDRHSLQAFAAVNSNNITHIKQAIALFGGVYIGVGLPLTAQNQDVWDVDSDPKDSGAAPWSWGGHCVWCLKYTPEKVTCITWGGLKEMTWAFFQTYCDEAYALLSPEFITADGKAPSGFDLATLQSDLSIVTS